MDIELVLLNFWDYSIILPAAFLCILPVMDHCKIKSKWFIPIMSVSIIVAAFILALALYYTKVDVNIPLLCAIVPSFFSYMVTFDVKRIKLWYIFITAIALFSFGGLATHYIKAIMEPTNGIYLAYAVKWFVSMLFILAEIVFLKQLRWLLDNDNVDSIWNLVWTVPLLITVMNLVMIPTDYANVRMGRSFSLYILFELTMIIFFFIVLVMQYAITRAVTNKAEAENNAQLLGLQAAQYDNLKKYLDNTARLRHDFTYMAKTARALAANGEIEQLQELLNDYGDRIDANSAPPSFCENNALNAITAYFVSEAQNNDINIIVKLNVSQDIQISDYEICSIVGNILDNALSAAKNIKSESAEVLFVADTKINGDLYLAVSNTYDGSINKKDGKFLSTKNGGHGIGLESVKAIVRKNNGYCNFRYDDKKFYSEILLRQV